MKFLGSVKDPKDLTTKEYVDSADEKLKDSLSRSMKNLEDRMLEDGDISEYSAAEVVSLWNSALNKVR